MAGKRGGVNSTVTKAIVCALCLVAVCPFFYIGSLPESLEESSISMYLTRGNRNFVGGNQFPDDDSRQSTGEYQSPSLSMKSPPPHVAKDFFYLNCPKDVDRPPGQHNLSLVYRVDVTNNWEDIVRDQMHTVITCGLGRWASSFDVLVSPGGADTESRVASVMKEYSGFVVSPLVVGLGNKGNKSEVGTTADRIAEACHHNLDKSGEKRTVILFYFRNSGALTYHPDWRRHKSITDEGPYSRSLYWRKYAEWFTLERPQWCIEKILGGAWTCGVTAKKSRREQSDSVHAR